LKTQLFTFDRFGNLTKVQTTGQATEDFPTTETTNRMALSIASYDNRGNLTTFNDGTTSFTNSFDALNRQWKRLAPDGTHDYYLYTADDERILTFSPSTAMSWHWILRDFGGKVLRNYEFINSEMPGADVVAAVKDYIHAGERVLGTEDPRVPGTSAMYATVDHLGTPRLWTDAAGNDVRKLKYYPFGKEATPSDQWNVALQFTGHERDRNDLTLATDDGDFMHARYGAPSASRLLSVDPGPAFLKSPQMWNRFSYALGNPLAHTDPTGEVVSFANLDAEQRRALIDSLSYLTGNKLDLDANSNLVVVESGEGGSETAKATLGELMAPGQTYSVLAANEDNNAFYFGAQPDGRNEIWLNFADFEMIDYGKVSRGAFSIGTVFFHEATHLPGFGLSDPVGMRQLSELGAPEEFVNGIRSELGLPQRVDSYRPRSFGERYGLAFESRTGGAQNRDYIYYPKK
jgi:RHS repeat-associated protein